MPHDASSDDRPLSTDRARTQGPMHAGSSSDWSTRRLASGASTHRPPFPRAAKWGFPAAGVLSVTLVLLAWSSGAGLTEEPEPESPFPVADATAALMDTRLPMEVNERVERWVRRFLGSHRSSFQVYLVREGLYGGAIRHRLRERGMPEELLYLAMIESGFSPFATSPAAASGVWQFTASTARAYGLTVDAWVDERRDPLSATDAALDYLEELHADLGSWYLAAAAYNAGPWRVRQAMRRAGLPDEGHEALYWEIVEHLPAETRQYVPKLLAAALLAQEPEHWGFEVERSLPYLFDQVLVPAGTPLTRVADAIDVGPSLIRDLNPHLMRGATPPDRSLLVRIPQGESQKLVAALSLRNRAASSRD